MNRSTLAIFAGLAIGVAAAVGAQSVVAPDGAMIDNALTAPAGNSLVWVRVGLGAPIEVTPDDQGALHLPQFENAGLLILNAVSGEPVTAGSLSWRLPGLPSELAGSS